MKTVKLLGIITLAMVIGFTITGFNACIGFQWNEGEGANIGGDYDIRITKIEFHN